MGSLEATPEGMNVKEQDKLKDKASNPEGGQLNKLDATVELSMKEQEKVQDKAYNPEEKLDAAL